MSPSIKLSELAIGARAQVCTLDNPKPLCSRLMALGLYPGEALTPLFRAACGDPTAYLIQNTVIALRRSDAEKISVIPIL